MIGYAAGPDSTASLSGEKRCGSTLNRKPLESVAQAKVNIGIEIVGRRSDGYHNISTVIQKIRLHDSISVEPANSLNVRMLRREIPGEENLAYRAALLLSRHGQVTVGADILIRKRIPIAAGLAGGSSDAATTLTLLNQLWGTGLNQDELCRIGFRAGADVPALLTGTTVLVAGMGEIARPLPPPRRRWLVLTPVEHSLARKTERMYKRLGPADFTDGSTVAEAAKSLEGAGDFDEDLMHNGFWRVAAEEIPGLRERARHLREIAGRPAHLAGAGPTLFCLFDRRAEAREAAGALRSRGIEAILSATI